MRRLLALGGSLQTRSRASRMYGPKLEPRTKLKLVDSVLMCVVLLALGCSTKPPADVVVYCAHDAQYAEAILNEFEQQTGLNVDVRFDEEASKSLGLTNRLIAEQTNPQCDVFWNNQTLGTIRLQSGGLLQPYVSPRAARIPERFKDVAGDWTGFAGRLRVYLVNTAALEAKPEAVLQVLEGESLSRVAIAQPMFGTTLSHYSVLAAEWGFDELQRWHAEQRQKGIREVRGNAMTRDLVAEGICDVAYTDTDDAFAAIDHGKPVAMLPVRLKDGATVCIPNSVAMIADCPHPQNARTLIDFLLSEETELKLAESAARQIPLGDVDENRLNADVKQLRDWARDGVDLKQAAAMNEPTLQWLTREYTGQ